MKWRYGIVKFRSTLDKNHRFYGVGELYFDKDPLRPHSCTEQPVSSILDLDLEDTVDDIRDSIVKNLNRMISDCNKFPIFDIDGPYAIVSCGGKKQEDYLRLESQVMTDEEIDSYLKTGRRSD